MAKPKVSIFWDNSNMFIPAKYVANRKERGFAEQDIRIHFDKLYDLARGGREVQSAVCVGSVPLDLQSVWRRIEDVGVVVELYERGQDSHTEQGIDSCLQVHMLRALADVQQPGVAVLLTGDGAGYETGVGFHADLERMFNRGWGIEVLSWGGVCDKRLKKWASEVGAYIDLEDYYDSITFLVGTRYAKPINMTHRRFATPKPPAPGQSSVLPPPPSAK